MNKTDISPSQPSSAGPIRRQKRIRVNFTHKQIEAMETVFRQTQYPDVTILEILADKLKLPVEKICTWFQNRRSKFRKESKKGHIQWMRQQMYGDSDLCSGVPVTQATSNAASHVLSPPTEGEVKKSPPMHQVPNNNYQQPNQIPMTPYCMNSTYSSTPSPPHPIAASTYSPPEYGNNQLPANNCMTSWSNHQSLSSTHQYPGYDVNTMSSCTAAYRDTSYMSALMSQYPPYPETPSYGYSLPNIDMSEYNFNKISNDWNPQWYDSQQINGPGYLAEIPQISPISM